MTDLDGGLLALAPDRFPFENEILFNLTTGSIIRQRPQRSLLGQPEFHRQLADSHIPYAQFAREVNATLRIN